MVSLFDLELVIMVVITLLLNITRLSKMLILKLLRFNNNKVDGNNSDSCDDLLNPKLFKFKQILAFKYVFTF